MKIYIGDVNETKRPFSMDDPNDKQSYDNWRIIVDEKTPEQALSELMEILNNDDYSLDNNWLRMR